MKTTDVAIIGSGHNGLVAAILLAKAGLKVTVFEEKDVLGGATRTERPFKKAPDLATSTGSYLLGLFPPELMEKLDVRFPVLRRDPHYFLPTTDRRYLLFGSDAAATKAQFTEFFSAEDFRAHEALQAEIAQIREDLAPTWLKEPLSIEETAEKYVRSELRGQFVDLCRKPISDYLGRFPFKSDLLTAMYATTDAFSGLTGGWDTPGTGMNFLIHNMCRLPGSDGTWMIVKGGMGTVASMLIDKARSLGVAFESGKAVTGLVYEGGAVTGIVRGDDETRARTVVSNADPFRMRELAGRDHFPEAYNARLDAYVKKGTTFKVNLALRGLPKFTCLPGAAASKGGYGPTIHLLPDEKDVMASLRRSFADAEAGRLPDFPTIEWYIHTTVDPSLKDSQGHHNSALFVQWVPYDLAGTTWEVEEARYVKHLLSICDRFAPGTSDLVVDTFPLSPRGIEAHFGIRYGHIHHVDNSFGFSDRLPYRTPIDGLYSASAGCHPGGSVIGASGHNAAEAVLRDLRSVRVAGDLPETRVV